MKTNLDEFGLALSTVAVPHTSHSYRPPSWPPPRDWCIVEDKNGQPVSRWGDSTWDFSLWYGRRLVMSFGDGPKPRSTSPTIDPVNADILRMLATWRIWGPRGAQSIKSVYSNFFHIFRSIIGFCSAKRIVASDLYRYPALIRALAQVISPSKFEYALYELDRILESQHLIGFSLLDKEGIQQLKAAQPEFQSSQTEYIPTRIWTYQVNRLKACLDDYLAHQQGIENCFRFCVEAYDNNHGTPNIGKARNSSRNPFIVPGTQTGAKTGAVFHGAFALTATRFGIRELLAKWGDPEELRIKSFVSYLSLVQYAGLAYVANFSLMRIQEVASIRADCLEWHTDDTFGRIPLIRGETTKTIDDSDARWIVSPSVDAAVTALRSVAALRNSCLASPAANPHLLSWVTEPWGRTKSGDTAHASELQPPVPSFSQVVRRYPKLFDAEHLRVTEEDFRIALAITPTLDAEVIRIGSPWPLAWHQLRRTGAVNMFASGKISDASVQLQLKHLTRAMPLYYGSGNSGLHFNEETRIMLVNSQYEAMGRELAAIHTDRFVSPYGEQHKLSLLPPAHGLAPVQLITEHDAAHYETAARKHEISFRRTALGGCMKNGQCNGDCVESVGDCAGGNGAPCNHVLFDRERANANQIRLDGVLAQLAVTPSNTPRLRALEQEKRGLENYFVYISRS